MKKFLLCFFVPVFAISYLTDSDFDKSKKSYSSQIQLKNNTSISPNKASAFNHRVGDSYECPYTYLQDNNFLGRISDMDQKETLLRVPFGLRYASNIDPKRKDRDWEISMANRKA